MISEAADAVIFDVSDNEHAARQVYNMLIILNYYLFYFVQTTLDRK